MRSIKPFISIGVLLALLLSFILLTSQQPSQAQDFARDTRFDPDVQIAFVSNRAGDEDIYRVRWDGWAGWANETVPINLTQNDAGARDWNPAWSPDGARIAFNSDRNGGLAQIYTMNVDGTQTRPLFPNATANDLAPAWSPDGALIAFASDRGGLGWDIYLVRPDGTDLRRLTRLESILGDPSWTPDGGSITLWERRLDGALHIFRIDIDEPDRQQRLTFNGQNNGMPFWSPDGTLLYYESDRTLGRFQIFAAQPDGNAPRPLTGEAVNSGRAALSPDGELIIFTSDRDDSDELYLINADGTQLERLTVNDWSDHSPAWQPAVPPLAQEIVVAAPTPVPTEVPQEGGEDSGSDLFALGQSVNNVDIYPIRLETLRANYGIEAWNQAGWRGQGMRIGVIDLGFGGLFEFEARIGRNVTLPRGDDPNIYDADESDHGRRVLEIINAIAPDAALFACRYDGSLDGLTACADYMNRTEQVDIVNHSAGIPTFPLDGNNPWALIAEDAANSDVLWVNSSGNYRQSFYARAYDDRDRDNFHDFNVMANRSIDELTFAIEDTYTGNVILTWENARGTVDLDLEVIGQTGNIIARSAARQSEDDELPPVERIFLNNVREPFQVRVRRFDGPSNPQFMLVVEFLAINPDDAPDVVPDGSSVAPSDATNVIAVGAVRTVERERGERVEILPDQLAPYSSYGLLNADLDKPDITAYGELVMPDGTAFFGTSAAAPVVTGSLALYRQAYDELPSDTLRQGFLREAVHVPPEYISARYGAGVLMMPSDVPVFFAGQGDVEIQPWLVFPRPAAVDLATPVPRCGGVPTRLAIGVEGYVTYELGLGFRSAPTTQAGDLSFLRNLQLGDEFTVLDGPVCGGNANWWFLELFDGSQGWVSEGASYYLITPSLYARAEVPEGFSLACPGAPDPRIQVGDRAEVVNAPAGGLTMWHLRSRFDVIGTLGQGTQMQVLGGPHCEVDIATRIWYVRVLSGRWTGAQGWVSEARPTVRWVDRVELVETTTNAGTTVNQGGSTTSDDASK
ncbi:MAG: S8 family serine peptidase [Chloroflexi bacterium]|nr:S8 family serine peptidase [Chloroflexota bacterium]